MGEFIKHAPCPMCGSHDALAIYTDNEHCFSCGYHKSYNTNREEEESRYVMKDLIPKTELTYRALKARGIREETCRKFDYGVAAYENEYVQVATYRDIKGRQVAQHLRYPDKRFKWLGNSKEACLFGQSLWGKSKRLVITEGEIDALTVAQSFGLSWAVVSLPNGVQSAWKSLSNQMDWLNQFDEIILWFDDDPAGREGIDAVLPLFTTVRVVRATGYKDANDLYLAKGSKAVANAVFNATVVRPDGIVDLQEVTMDKILEAQKDVKSYKTGYPLFDKKTLGLRKAEITTVTAGTGIGKTTWTRELTLKLVEQKLKVGYIALEENIARSLLGFFAIKENIPLWKLFIDPEAIPKERQQELYDELKPYLYLYDHFGSLEVENLLAKIRYMIKALGVDFIVLDHLSIVVSGLETENERKAIDIIMTKLRSLADETGVGIILISHLKNKTQGKSYEEGAEVTINDLRGSGGIKHISDLVVALERNMQEGEHISTLKILKNRFTGETGVADKLTYVQETGRLVLKDEETQTIDPETVFNDGGDPY